MKKLPSPDISTNGILWNRLKYVLSPQFDMYEVIARAIRGKVADIGFGTGFGTHLLTLRTDGVYGFEIDEEAIKFARRVFPFPNLHFEYGDILKGVPNDYGKFNYVIMVDVIEHIEDDRKALENARKCLMDKGFLLCSTPNKQSRYRKSENHVREYSPKEFKVLLKEVFPVVDLRNYKLEPLASEYENPIIGVCCNVEKKEVKKNG